MDLVTQAEYARSIGKSKAWINKLVKRGVLRLKGKKLDPVKASTILKVQYDPTKIELHKHNKNQKGEKKISPNIESEKTSESEINDPYNSNEDLETALSLHQARVLKENMLAKLKEAEYNKLIGELISIDKVFEVNAKIATTIRTKLLLLRSTLAPKIYGLEIPEIESVLDDAINDILKEYYELRKQSDLKLESYE